MNKDGQMADRHLKSLDLGAVIHEPDSKVPPDFAYPTKTLRRVVDGLLPR